MEKQNKIKIALVDAQNKPIKPNGVYVFIDASNLWRSGAFGMKKNFQKYKKTFILEAIVKPGLI